MSEITHHLTGKLLLSYSAGSLPHAFSVAVSSHISMCDACRVEYEALQAVGGAVMDGAKPVAVSEGLRDVVLSMLDTPQTQEPGSQPFGVLPGPVVAALNGREPKWKKLGMGVSQDILFEDGEGSVRLLRIPPGQAVPDHGHNGLELTLVLQGSFSDKIGRFGVGDIELADASLDHMPVADSGDVCICLAATDTPLRFRAWMPRLLQPVFRI